MAVARASLGELLDWLDQRGGRCALNGRKVGVITRGSRCLNFKNRRKNAPVRYCSMCGEVVNKNIAAKQCSEEGHAKQRRSQNKYCVDVMSLKLQPVSLVWRRRQADDPRVSGPCC